MSSLLSARLLFSVFSIFLPVLSSCFFNTTVGFQNPWLFNCTNETKFNVSWYFNGKLIVSSNGWRTILNNGSLRIDASFYWDVGQYQCCTGNSCSCIISLTLTDFYPKEILKHFVPKNMNRIRKGSLYWMPDQLLRTELFMVKEPSTDIVCHFVSIQNNAHVEIIWTSIETDDIFKTYILKNDDLYHINTSSYSCLQPVLKMRNSTCYHSTLTIMRIQKDRYFTCHINKRKHEVLSRQFQPILWIPGLVSLTRKRAEMLDSLVLPDVFAEIARIEAEEREERAMKTLREALANVTNEQNNSCNGASGNWSLDFFLATTLSGQKQLHTLLSNASNASFYAHSLSIVWTSSMILYIAIGLLISFLMSNCSEIDWVAIGFLYSGIFICMVLILIAKFLIINKSNKRKKRRLSVPLAPEVILCSPGDQSEVESHAPSAPLSYNQIKFPLNYAELDDRDNYENNGTLSSGYESQTSPLNEITKSLVSESFFANDHYSLAMLTFKKQNKISCLDVNSVEKPRFEDKLERNINSLSRSSIYRTSKRSISPRKYSLKTPLNKLAQHGLRHRRPGASLNRLALFHHLDISITTLKTYLIEMKLLQPCNLYNQRSSTKWRPGQNVISKAAYAIVYRPTNSHPISPKHVG